MGMNLTDPTNVAASSLFSTMVKRLLAASLVVPAALATLGLVGGCFSSPADDAAPKVTYHKDVEPLLQSHCLSCHSQGGIAPFALGTYQAAKAYASTIASVTQAGIMPPWGAVETPACKPRFKWQADPRLSAPELATLAAWTAQGAPEGDPKDAPPAYVAPARGLPNADVELAPKVGFTVTDKTHDTFRCFVIDPKLTQPAYINGTNIVPGNPQVVHHVLLFTDPKGDSQKQPLGPDGGYDCFGGVGVSDTSLLMGWVPGMMPQEFPANVGTRIDKGSLLVMQIHYHPHSLDAVDAVPDVTKVQLRYSKVDPAYELTSALIGNFSKPIPPSYGFSYDPTDPNALPSFVIPANTKGKTVTQRFQVPPQLDGKATPTLYLYGVGGHMHWVGTETDISLKRGSVHDGEPESECLLSIPHWDFDWQRVYHPDAAIESLPQVRAFDELQIKCTYDNTLGNPAVASALEAQGLSQPQDVSLGEQTLDEMCLGVFQVVFKR